MTLNDFITNLSGLSDDGKDFPKELLKVSKPLILSYSVRSSICSKRAKGKKATDVSSRTRIIFNILRYININKFCKRNN